MIDSVKKGKQAIYIEISRGKRMKLSKLSKVAENYKKHVDNSNTLVVY